MVYEIFRRITKNKAFLNLYYIELGLTNFVIVLSCEKYNVSKFEIKI